MPLYSRARTILGMIGENSVTDSSNEDHNDSNAEKSFNHELQNEDNHPVELDKEVAMEGQVTIEAVDFFDNNNEEAIEKPQLEDTHPNKPLVPYYDSDITMSDNEDYTTQHKTTEEENKNEEDSVRQSSSSSSSSSTSSSGSSSSSSSSSSSDSKSLRSAQQANFQSHNTRHVTVVETDDDDVIENTRPQQLCIGKNRRNAKLNRHPREVRTPNYYTSPIYTDESEVDLSDTDPTFVNVEPGRKRNYFFDQSSSSSTSSSNSSRIRRPAPKQGRKRIKNPSQWKQNKMKRMRNKGKSYVSMSKTQKSVAARCLKEPCTDKCRLKCTSNINMDSRYELFRKFWDLGDLGKQRAYISASMVDVQSRYKYTNAERPRNNNKAFHFVVDNNMIRVCKTFYKATLDITDRMIFTVQKKYYKMIFHKLT